MRYRLSVPFVFLLISSPLHAEDYAEHKIPIQAFIKAHAKHANDKDFEAYMGDFCENLRVDEDNVAFSQRAMALEELNIEVKDINFHTLEKKSAVIYVRQIARYAIEGSKRSVDAIVSYRLRMEEGTQWCIKYSERRHFKSAVSDENRGEDAGRNDFGESE